MANELSTDKQAKKMRNKDNIKKHLKRTAIGLAAGATLAAAPGTVGAVKNVKAQNLNRQKAAQEYQMSQQELNTRRNEIAKKIRDTGIEVKDTAKKAGPATKEAVAKAKSFLQKKAQSAMQEAKNKKKLNDENKVAVEVKNYTETLASELNSVADHAFDKYDSLGITMAGEMVDWTLTEYLKGLILREGEDTVKKAIGQLKMDYHSTKSLGNYSWAWDGKYKKAIEELKQEGFLNESINYFPY